ncbi:MAG: cytochrome c oxidase subunit II [Chloroflexi bacterium]|nr:MAG: cytochrome c oxidase subunit II [Chloroflexota bacterium]
MMHSGHRVRKLGWARLDHRQPALLDFRGVSAIITVVGAVVMAATPLSASAAIDVSPLDCAGANACRIQSVYAVVFWMAMFVLAVVGGLLVYAAIRFRRRDETEPAQIHGNSRLEVAWTVFPLVVLLAIFTLTFTNMDYVRNGPPGPITITVTGQQFAWTYKYPNGFVAGTLTIPAGEVIRLDVTSRDVLHSFWAPRLGGQVYALPGQMNHGWLEADHPGTYYGQCNELCGIGHAEMQVKVVVMSKAAYDQWYAGLKAAVFAPAARI